MFLTRIARVERNGPSAPYASNPVLNRYFADMLHDHDAAFDEQLYAAGNRNTFTELAAALLSTMAPLEPVDLVVIAHAVSDCDPHGSTAGFLSEHCPGHPVAFAISDEGVSAPFTAMQVALSYLRDETYTRALVIVLDQATTPYPETVVRCRHSDYAVGLLLAANETHHALVVIGELQRHRDITANLLPELLTAKKLGSLFSGAAIMLVTSPEIGPLQSLPREWSVRPTRSEAHCAAVWYELPCGLSAATGSGQTVVLASYDNMFGQLCMLPLVPAGSAASRTVA